MATAQTPRRRGGGDSDRWENGGGAAQIERDHGTGTFTGGYQVHVTGYGPGCCGYIFVYPLLSPYTGLIKFDGLGRLLDWKK
jgi:hypothetical protein